MDTIRVWTRSELEEAARADPHEQSMLRIAVSPKLLLLLMDYASQSGDRVEMLSAYGDPSNCELRFYRREGAD